MKTNALGSLPRQPVKPPVQAQPAATQPAPARAAETRESFKTFFDRVSVTVPGWMGLSADEKLAKVRSLGDRVFGTVEDTVRIMNAFALAHEAARRALG